MHMFVPWLVHFVCHIVQLIHLLCRVLIFCWSLLAQIMFVSDNLFLDILVESCLTLDTEPVLLPPAILWWIAPLRRWISTGSTRTTWLLPVWPSSRASGTNLSPAPSTTHWVSQSHTHSQALCGHIDFFPSCFLLIDVGLLMKSVCLCPLLAEMKEPVFEFIFPPVYHPPQVKFPHRQPLRYLDRYRDGKEHTYGIYWSHSPCKRVRHIYVK